MKNIRNLEIINISTLNGQVLALLSYQDVDRVSDVNNGYNITYVPINIRELQTSHHGNLLLDQSIKAESLMEGNDE